MSLSTFLILAGLALNPSHALAQRELTQREIDSINRDRGKPDIMFAVPVSASLNGTNCQVLGMTRRAVIVTAPNGRIQTVSNSKIRMLVSLDGVWQYEPKKEKLEDFASRLSQVNGIRGLYGLVANEDAISDILFGDSATGSGVIFTALPRPPVPMPVYAMAKPWEKVNPLNPPPPPPKPKPVVRPTSTPPSQPAPAPTGGGIPDWAKYVIAAGGILLVINFFRG